MLIADHMLCWCFIPKTIDFHNFIRTDRNQIEYVNKRDNDEYFVISVCVTHWCESQIAGCMIWWPWWSVRQPSSQWHQHQLWLLIRHNYHPVLSFSELSFSQLKTLYTSSQPSLTKREGSIKWQYFTTRQLNCTSCWPDCTSPVCMTQDAVTQVFDMMHQRQFVKEPALTL